MQCSVASPVRRGKVKEPSWFFLFFQNFSLCPPFFLIFSLFFPIFGKFPPWPPPPPLPHRGTGNGKNLNGARRHSISLETSFDHAHHQRIDVMIWVGPAPSKIELWQHEIFADSRFVSSGLGTAGDKRGYLFFNMNNRHDHHPNIINSIRKRGYGNATLP